MQCKSLMNHDTPYMNGKCLSACSSDRWSPRPGNTLACQKPPHGLAGLACSRGSAEANLTLLRLPAVSSLRPAWHSPSGHPHGLTCSPDTHPFNLPCAPLPTSSCCCCSSCSSNPHSTPCPLLQRPCCESANAARSPLEPSKAVGKPTDASKEACLICRSVMLNRPLSGVGQCPQRNLDIIGRNPGVSNSN